MDYTLRIGEQAAIRRNFFGTTWYVLYAGMPADARYSIAVTWTMGYHATSYHLFLTESTRDIPFKGGRLRIHELSPEQIRFSYDRS
jgi:hypothetical protein